MKNQEIVGATLLQVRTRLVVGDRRHSSQASVHCPRRDSSIPVTYCMTCCEFESYTTGAGGTTIRCAHPVGCTRAGATRERGGVSVKQLRLSEFMTRDVLCVYPDLRVNELRAILEARGIDGAPVVAEDGGRPIGVVSRTDLARALRADAIVADVMIPLALVLPESATLYEAAALMRSERVHGLPVVSADGVVVGMVSTLDITRTIAARGGTRTPV